METLIAHDDLEDVESNDFFPVDERTLPHLDPPPHSHEPLPRRQLVRLRPGHLLGEHRGEQLGRRRLRLNIMH